jgi:hypothetical protein
MLHLGATGVNRKQQLLLVALQLAPERAHRRAPEAVATLAQAVARISRPRDVCSMS